MEPENSLPHLQVPATCPYPEPARSIPCPSPIPLPDYPSFAVVSEPALYRLLTFQVPNLMSFFHYLGRTKISMQVQGKSLHYVTMTVFMVRSCQHLAQLPNWKTTTCRLSVIAYSIFSQLPSILEAVPPCTTQLRAMPWWQGPTSHGVMFIHVEKSRSHRIGRCMGTKTVRDAL